jgi:hypothetical protein
MPWYVWDNPPCCAKAGWLINWRCKGRPVPKPGEKFKIDGRFDYGPERDGWATYFESGGPGCPSHWENVFFCPFCGKKLSELEPPDAPKRPKQ